MDGAAMGKPYPRMGEGGSLAGILVLVAVGANLPGADGRAPRRACEWAVERVAALPGLHLVAISGWYATASVPPGQPDYVNGAVALEADAPDPHALLRALHGIEAEAGRVRTERWGPRTLDLDLLAVGDRVVADTLLTLPHPRLHERGFVLRPLCDVAPGWRHPLLGRTAAALLAACPGAAAPRPLPPEGANTM